MKVFKNILIVLSMILTLYSWYQIITNFNVIKKEHKSLLLLLIVLHILVMAVFIHSIIIFELIPFIVFGICLLLVTGVEISIIYFENDKEEVKEILTNKN